MTRRLRNWLRALGEGGYFGGGLPVHDHSNSGNGGVLPRTVAIPSTDNAALHAWMKYNGATQTVGGSYGVSSVTRNGVGNYTMNFSTNQASANFGAAGATSYDNLAGRSATTIFPHTYAVGSFRFMVGATAEGQDDSLINVQVANA